MDNEMLVQLGQKIRDLRIRKGLTQAELANLCGCNRNYISMLERGERNPSYKSLVMIAHGLSAKIQDIVWE